MKKLLLKLCATGALTVSAVVLTTPALAMIVPDDGVCFKISGCYPPDIFKPKPLPCRLLSDWHRCEPFFLK